MQSTPCSRYRLASCMSGLRGRVPGQHIGFHGIAGPARKGVQHLVTRERGFHASATSHKTVPFCLADIGEGITECEIIRWCVIENPFPHGTPRYVYYSIFSALSVPVLTRCTSNRNVKPGDTVEEFDMLCEVQSDKASVEISSRYSGRIVKLDYGEGDVAKVGTSLCQIELADNAEVCPSDLGEDPLVPDGGKEKGASSGATSSGPPSEPGTHPLSDGPAPEVSSSGNASGIESTLANAQEVAFPVAQGKPLATPAVRRLTQEYSIDLKMIGGSGKQGRVLKEDVLRHLKQDQASTSSATVSGIDPEDEEEAAGRFPITGLRRAMFKAMTRSLQVPHFGFSEEVDVTELEQVRQQLSSHLPPHHSNAGAGKVTMLPLLIKALSIAMGEHALFRSTLQQGASEEEGGVLLRRATHDVSFAVATVGGGLLTPVLAGVEKDTVYDLAARIGALTLRAKQGALAPAELSQAGTVTVSNIGSVGGGTNCFPLLPPTGQLAIGAIGRARWLPRYRDQVPSLHFSNGDAATESMSDQLVRRLVLPVSFSADHRVVSGVELAEFVLRWKQLLEHPWLWIGLL